MRVEMKLTQPSDLVRLSVGEYAPAEGARFVGWTAWAGRRVVAIGGVTPGDDGKLWGYFMTAPDYRGGFPLKQHRLARVLVRRLIRAGLRIYAACDTTQPKAAEWLASLGFRPTDETQDGQTVMIAGA